MPSSTTFSVSVLPVPGAHPSRHAAYTHQPGHALQVLTKAQRLLSVPSSSQLFQHGISVGQLPAWCFAARESSKAPLKLLTQLIEVLLHSGVPDCDAMDVSPCPQPTPLAYTTTHGQQQDSQQPYALATKGTLVRATTD